jgi:hypothetical protein
VDDSAVPSRRLCCGAGARLSECKCFLTLPLDGPTLANMKPRHAAALALVLCASFSVTGCGTVIAYDRMQEENDRQALLRDYRRCVESHQTDPSVCDHITSGLAATAVTVHQSGN